MTRSLSPRQMNRLISHQKRTEARLAHGGLSVSYANMPDFWAELSLSDVQTRLGPDDQDTQSQTAQLRARQLPDLQRSDRLIIDGHLYTVTSFYTDEDGYGRIIAKRQVP